MNVLWSPRAAREADRAVRYIARDRPRVAADWLTGLRDAVSRLAEFPNSGHSLPELPGSSRREIPYGGYRVIYRVRAEHVEILRVVHARRNWHLER
ncbi:type II toxin-antitoxin system RelE/ParE family toxin [Longimicrobium sp.]|uniref:type II toxin-antitoxin system RelE/ParE family toxin n=1 Tax=Longimicrobium sp. TaxID=2029185 RepID=UPI002F9323EF